MDFQSVVKKFLQRLLAERRGASDQRILESSHAAQSISQQRVEGAARRMEDLLSAVSDCVFLFSDGSLEFANAEGEAVLNSVGSEKDYIVELLKEAASRPKEEFPLFIEIPDAKNGNILLSVRSAIHLTLEQPNVLLVSAENQSTLVDLAEQADCVAVAERRRIGRNLHDGLSQLLTSLSLQIHAFATTEDDPHVRQEMEEASRQIQSILSTGSEITHELEES